MWYHSLYSTSYGHIFLSNQDGLLGSRYKKAVFREYTDGTFKIPRPRTGPEEHLGILGEFFLVLEVYADPKDAVSYKDLFFFQLVFPYYIMEQ